MGRAGRAGLRKGEGSAGAAAVFRAAAAARGRVRAGTGPAAAFEAEPAAAPRAAAPWSSASRFGSKRSLKRLRADPPPIRRGTGEAVRKPDGAPWARASDRE